MPRKPASTLEPLLKLREEQVDTRMRELQQRVAEAHQARVSLDKQQQAKRQHEQQTQQQVEEETARADAGESSLRDLAMMHAWHVVQLQRAQTLQARVCAAQDQVRSAEQGQARATQGVADARAAARVVEQHRDRVVAAAKRQEELQLEEDAGDDASARMLRRRG